MDIDLELDSTIRQLFRDPDAARLLVLGGRQRPPLDVSIEERVRLFELDLRAYLTLLARQVPEFEPDDVAGPIRLEAEGTALLVALRELHRLFGEVL